MEALELDVEIGAEGALRRACDYLLSLQHPDGWWKGELETNVTMDAEDLLLREFLGIREPALTDARPRWIRSQQRADGSWSNFHGGPGDLSTTIEAYVALRLAGDDARMPRTCARRVHSSAQPAGSSSARVFTHIWLALFGAWSWERGTRAPAGADAAAAVGRRSTPTTSPAGRARRSSR